MRKTLTTLLAGAAIATLGGAASAQIPYGGYGYGQQTATLYELPNFQGRSVTVNGQDANLSGSGFNDRARSARFEGAWTVCVDANFGGRCETLSGAVAYLPSSLSAAASSLRSTSGYGGYPGYPGGTPGYPGYPGSGTAVLYEYPNFQGRSVTIHTQEDNLDHIGFNDRARSARFEGSWRVCEDAAYRGRCETFTGSVPNLSLRLNGASSLQVQAGGYPGYPGYPGVPGYPGYPGHGQGVQGQSVVFYPGPAQGGYGAPYGSYGGTRRAAEDFCRQQGHRGVAWYDTSGRVLSDVLCRR